MPVYSPRAGFADNLTNIYGKILDMTPGVEARAFVNNMASEDEATTILYSPDNTD